MIGGATELIATGKNEFAFPGAKKALVKFLTNADGKPVMMIGSGYLEKRSDFAVVPYRVLVVMAFLFIVSSVILWVVSVVGAITGRLSWRKAMARAVPVMGLAALIFVFSLVMYVQVTSFLSYKFGAVNDLTLSVFFGGIFFALATSVTIYQATTGFRNAKGKVFPVYYALIALSMCFIMSILLANGWIGLRFWAL